MKIQAVRAYQVYDSRGDPTVEAVIQLTDGTVGRGIVPAGASTGAHEAKELRDGDPKRFLGRSVFRAVGHVNGELADLLIGRNVLDQPGLDASMNELDGTPDKSRLGANAILAVSLAAVQAAAALRREPLHVYLGKGRGHLLPLPEIQIFGGGKHAHGRVDVQDFMIIALGAKTFEETLEITFNVYRAAGKIMRRRGRQSGVADEGGHWPDFATNEEALGTLIEAIEAAGYTPGRDVGVSLDLAATDLYHEGRYEFGLEQRKFTTEEFIELVISWVDRFAIVSLEDPLAEDDWAGWQKIRQAIGHRCQLIGDDLFTTNVARIERGIADAAANAVLIKLNQIGTVTETLRAIEVTQAAGWLPVISARSGESEDAFIAHLAVATNAGQLKVGSFARGERTSKWNEVLRISDELGSTAEFRGAQLFLEHGISQTVPR